MILNVISYQNLFNGIDLKIIKLKIIESGFYPLSTMSYWLRVIKFRKQ
jgi:hypothetical protein